MIKLVRILIGRPTLTGTHDKHQYSRMTLFVSGYALSLNHDLFITHLGYEFSVLVKFNMKCHFYDFLSIFRII